MPTIKQMVKEMHRIDSMTPADRDSGYPISFNSDWAKVRFVIYMKWYSFSRRILKAVKR